MGVQPWALSLPDKELCLREALAVCTPPAPEPSAQSCPTLCDPIDGSPLGSSVPGFLHARILEWVAISFSKFYAAAAKSLQSCPTLCNPVDGSPLGSSVPGILQARILEWVAPSYLVRNPTLAPQLEETPETPPSSRVHWRRKWQPTPVFLPGESQGQRSLVGCRLRGCTESDTTEAT